MADQRMESNPAQQQQSSSWWQSLKSAGRQIIEQYLSVGSGVRDLRDAPVTKQQIQELDGETVILQGNVRRVGAQWNEEYMPVVPFLFLTSPIVDVYHLEVQPPKGERFSLRVISEQELPEGPAVVMGDVGRTEKGRLVLLGAEQLAA